MKVYQVQLKNFDILLVEANGYGDVEKKVKAYLEFNSDASSMFDNDGNLVHDSDGKHEIRDIRIVADFIIK